MLKYMYITNMPKHATILLYSFTHHVKNNTTKIDNGDKKLTMKGMVDHKKREHERQIQSALIRDFIIQNANQHAW